MTTNMTYALHQIPDPGQTARDIGQQVREQIIQSAREQALAARKCVLAQPGGGSSRARRGRWPCSSNGSR